MIGWKQQELLALPRLSPWKDLVNACRDSAEHGQWCGRVKKVILRLPDRGLMLGSQYRGMQSSKQMPACIECPASSKKGLCLHPSPSETRLCGMKRYLWWRLLDQLGVLYFALELSHRVPGWERRKGPQKLSLYEFCMECCVQGSSPIYSRLQFLWEEKNLVLR